MVYRLDHMLSPNETRPKSQSSISSTIARLQARLLSSSPSPPSTKDNSNGNNNNMAGSPNNSFQKYNQSPRSKSPKRIKTAFDDLNTSKNSIAVKSGDSGRSSNNKKDSNNDLNHISLTEDTVPVLKSPLKEVVLPVNSNIEKPPMFNKTNITTGTVYSTNSLINEYGNNKNTAGDKLNSTKLNLYSVPNIDIDNLVQDTDNEPTNVDAVASSELREYEENHRCLFDRVQDFSNGILSLLSDHSNETGHLLPLTASDTVDPSPPHTRGRGLLGKHKKLPLVGHSDPQPTRPNYGSSDNSDQVSSDNDGRGLINDRASLLDKSKFYLCVLILLILLIIIMLLIF